MIEPPDANPTGTRPSDAGVDTTVESRGESDGSDGGDGGDGDPTLGRTPAAAAPAPAKVSRQVPPEARRRVLVIEDNSDAAEGLRDALELADHTVELASDGPEGLATARVFEPDVVLCDIGLPRMDGFAVAQAFRADEALRSIHLVALSGYTMPADVARAKAAGFDRHLGKPPTLAQINAVIASAPRRGRQGDP